jgi:hypothetical protein
MIIQRTATKFAKTHVIPLTVENLNNASFSLKSIEMSHFRQMSLRQKFLKIFA